jgi:multiple antibiotic resistance protein
MASALFSIYLSLLVLYSPFFVLSCFVTLSRGHTPKERQRMAWKVALGVLVASVLLYLFGKYIFTLFGITIDAFRIGVHIRAGHGAGQISSTG